MSTNANFSRWLKENLDQREMTQADLARESGLTSAAISRIMRGSRGVGPEGCRAIAHALKLSEEKVFRQAGLLSQDTQESQDPEDPPTLKEWIWYYLQADEEERERMLEIAKTLSQRSRKE